MAPTNIVNAILRLRSIEVIMLPKNEKSGPFPQNYRPITPLPIMSEIARSVIVKRIQDHTDELGMMNNLDSYTIMPQDTKY